MRARPFFLTAAILVASLAGLFLRGRGAVGVVDTNVPIPVASSGIRVVDLVRPTPPAHAVYLNFYSNRQPPPGARLEVALSSRGRTRILLVRPGHPPASLAVAIRDLCAGRAALRIAPDRGWVDLGPVGDGEVAIQLLGILPGPFGLEAPRVQSTGRHGDLLITAAGPPMRPRWRLVVPEPVVPGEALARVFFFVRHSSVLATAGLLALGLLAGGTTLLFRGRAWPATVALVSSATLFHAVLLPPLQGADETSHAATIEAFVFRGTPPLYYDPYPRSFSIAAGALEQDRVQHQPGEPLPLGSEGARTRLAATLEGPLAAEALERGGEPPSAGVQAADGRAALFFRTLRTAAPVLRRLTFLDRLSAYRLLATAWGLVAFACGALLLRRARASDQVAVFYGLVALFPYSISTAGTCSNYAPAIGLGQLLAAAACAAILTSEPRVRRLAAAVFLAGAWVGILLWADFIFVALFGTAVVATWAGAERVARAGLSRRARLRAAAAGLVLATAAVVVLLATVRWILLARAPGDLDTVGPKTMAFMALLALSPLAVAAAVQSWVPRLAKRPEAEGRSALASVSAALAALAASGFLLTRWTAVELSTFPRLVVAYARTFLSNAFAWDQDPIAWKFWLGAFGWHDAFYPDAVYALARWGFVVLLVSFPLLAAPFLLTRPRAARALLLVSGAALSCGVVTLTLRYLAPMVPYGRFVLPVLPLAALPLATLLEGPGRERVLRGALLAAAALQVWTAVALLGSRWAFAT